MALKAFNLFNDMGVGSEETLNALHNGFHEAITKANNNDDRIVIP